MKRYGEIFYTTKYKGYVASKSGKVFSLKTNSLVNGKVDNDGYITLCLMVNGERKFVQKHILIAETFLTKKEGATQVNHKNKKRDDCRVSNLEWVTVQENMEHRSSTDENGN